MSANDADLSVPGPDDKTVRWADSAFQEGFTMIPNVVLLDEGLSVYAHRVYSLFLHYARQDEECWPGQGGLAKKTGCGERSVRAGIRELEDRGLLRTKRRGQGQTNVYILLAPRTAPDAGLDISRTAYGAGLERRMAPIPVEEDAVEEDTSSNSRGVVAVVERNRALPAKVDRKPVSPVEGDLAIEVLAEWNDQTGQRLTSRDWLAKIVMRIREYPALTLADHAHVIASSLAAPWWKGPAAPGVVYGSGAQFERSILTAQAGPQGDRRTGPGGGPTPDEMRRRAERLAEEGL